MVSAWKDRTYDRGYLESVLLVMVSDNMENRKLFENVFEKAFKRHGVNAVSTMTVIPKDKELDEDIILAEATRREMGSIFVTDLISAGEKAVYRPSPTGPSRSSPGISMFSYDYQQIYSYAYDPGYQKRKKFVKLESRLYETATEKLIWSFSSETIDAGSVNEVIQSLSKAVMKNLKRNALIK
jgi:hypothetical protein